MSHVRSTETDEIDLFELLETLWHGKWIVIALTALVTLIGLGYSQAVQPIYTVSIPYTLNIYPVSSLQFCGNDVDCIENDVKRRIINISNEDWNNILGGSRITLSTKNPLSAAQYEGDLERIVIMITNEVYDEAVDEIEFIKNEFSNLFIGSEISAENALHSERIVRSIDNGGSVISFDSASIVKSFPNEVRIVTGSVMLGGLIGVIFVLIRRAVRKRQNQSAET